MNGIKPGHKTTEFWGVIATYVLTIISMFLPEANVDPKEGVGFVTAITGIYIVGRSIVKAIHEKATGGRQRIPVSSGGAQ